MFSLSSLLVLIAYLGAVTAEELNVSSASAIKGSISDDQDIEVLSQLEQKGKQDVWKSYLELSGKKKFIARFSLGPFKGDVASVQSLTVKINCTFNTCICLMLH
jgi:hypothetical protein